MKKALIGGFLTLLGSLWLIPILAYAIRYPIDSWDPHTGRLMTTVMSNGTGFIALLAALLILLGLVVLTIEYFRKER